MFPFCKAGSLFSSCAVYAAPCSNGNQVSGLVCNQVSGSVCNQPRRALVCRCCFVQRFRVYPSPPPPGGAGKTGRLSGDSPCATTHSLLRLPAKHRPARCYSQVTSKLPASYPQVSSLSHYVFTSFQRNPIHYPGDVHLVFTTFDAIL